MRNKSFTKRILAVALCIIMVLSIVPMTASAASTSVPGAEGHILTDILTLTFTDGYDSTLIVYGTPGSYSTTEYTLWDNCARVHIPNYDSNEWYFNGWRTWYKGSWSGAGVTTSDKANPSRGDDGYYFEERTAASTVAPVGTMYVYKETLWKGTYYLSAIFEPLVTVNAGDGVSYTVSGASMRANNKYSTQYNSGMSIDYSADDGYIVTGVSTNYGTSYSDDGDAVSLTNVTRPATVNINARLKQQKVNFNANGGSGTMAEQTFEYGVEKSLSANTFTRTGYTFAGWNTKVDGTGTAYTDRQSVSIAPASDGDRITLYAQWEETPDVTSNYTVYFDTNGGEKIEPITVTFDEKYGKLPSSTTTGLSGGDSNWYLVDENGNVTDTKITRSSTVDMNRNHTLFVKRKVLAPTLKITLEVPGAISDGYQYYVPANSKRILTVAVNNQNTHILDYTYQWYKDGAVIDNATEAILTLDGNVSDAGTYTVKVTATLKDGTGIIVTSDTASAEKEQKVKILHAANTLYYDANGGEDGPSSNYTGGAGITVQTNEPTRSGYVFSGWNTKADGTGESYDGGATYTFVEDNGNGGCNVTLYAQWIKAYGVYVGGVQIIETNKGDVFGDGKVSYDAETGILTLNGYTYVGGGYQYGSYENDESGEIELYSAAIYSESSIIIKLEGDNSIQNTFTDLDKNQYGDGVVTEGGVTFIGDGNMSISSAYAIEADETVTIGSGTLEFHATDDGIFAADVIIRNNANVIILADRDGIVALEGDATVEAGANVIIDAIRDGIYANKDVAITDSSVTIDVGGDGIYSYDGSVVIDSTKTNISAIGPWLEGTNVSIKADGDYGIFAYNGLAVDKKLTILSPEGGSVGELTEKDYTYGTIVAKGTAAKEIVIEPLGYTVTITGLENRMAALVPAAQSLNDAYCEMYDVEDFSKILNTEKDGYTFGGWYTDEDCTEGNEFGFNDPVNADITIYAKWVSVSASDGTEKDDNTPSDNTQAGDDTEKGDNKPADSTQNGTSTEKDDNTPSNITSPDTGDNSNIWLWFTLLFISGSAVITLTVYDRKKRSAVGR